jgi:SH3 domain protein
MKWFAFILFAWQCLAFPAQAETAYVTDMLQLDMYATVDMLDKPILRLRSGDELELLERKGRYARIRSEGGQEGWVKGLYLVDKEPARTRVNKLERSNEGMENTVKKLRSQLSAEQSKVQELQQAQSGDAEQYSLTETELEDLRNENARLENRLSAYSSSVPVAWLLIAVGIALVGGIGGGWYWIDKRSRERHGGFRIY